jgi:hypothetical protein
MIRYNQFNLPAATVLSTLQRLFSKGVLVDFLPEFKNQRDARLLGRGTDFVHASCCVCPGKVHRFRGYQVPPGNSRSSRKHPERVRR